MDVIGLGTAGCRIAEVFSQYPQYINIYKVDAGVDSDFDFISDYDDGTGKNINCLSVPEQSSPEDYEKNTPDLAEYFKDLRDEVLFIVAGSGNISGMTLALLEQIKDRRITILLVRPDLSLLSEERKKIGRAVFGVLQEYTRSGVFERMLIVDNALVQKTLDKVSIMNFFEKMNELIVSTVHMITVHHNIDSVYENKLERPASCRIGSIGLYDMESSENKMMFDLDFPRYKRYFYCINQEKLDNDGGLLNTISSQMKEQVSSEEVDVSFGVYASKYENDYVYSIWYSNKIQDWS
tara:strand:- start:1450 stop:2331 length:882 start_codon:yes stop_codon:yes gene_type:complete